MIAPGIVPNVWAPIPYDGTPRESAHAPRRTRAPGILRDVWRWLRTRREIAVTVQLATERAALAQLADDLGAMAARLWFDDKLDIGGTRRD